MSTVALGIAAAAALACPAHMLWRMRRGHRATCGPAPSPQHDVAAVRRRQRDLEARITELSAQADEQEGRSYAPTGRG